MTPLACAVSRGKAIAVRYFLEKGADPDKEDIVGFTPLHYATKEGSISAPIHILMFTILSLHTKRSCQLLLIL
jgi:ankyrin repeat protein